MKRWHSQPAVSGGGGRPFTGRRERPWASRAWDPGWGAHHSPPAPRAPHHSGRHKENVQDQVVAAHRSGCRGQQACPSLRHSKQRLRRPPALERAAGAVAGGRTDSLGFYLAVPVSLVSPGKTSGLAICLSLLYHFVECVQWAVGEYSSVRCPGWRQGAAWRNR